MSGESADAAGHPFIRPYRTRADIQTWFDDPATWELIQTEYKRGYYRESNRAGFDPRVGKVE